MINIRSPNLPKVRYLGLLVLSGLTLITIGVHESQDDMSLFNKVLYRRKITSHKPGTAPHAIMDYILRPIVVLLVPCVDSSVFDVALWNVQDAVNSLLG
jgi:hypothetical protein